MTPLQTHIQKWSYCQECELCNGRKRSVLIKGTVPCDVLFLGEAPGLSEGSLGIPFALIPLVYLTSKSDVMGQLKNKLKTKISGYAIVALLTALNLILLFLIF